MKTVVRCQLGERLRLCYFVSQARFPHLFNLGRKTFPVIALSNQGGALLRHCLVPGRTADTIHQRGRHLLRAVSQLEVTAGNASGIHLYEKLGFEKEGLRRRGMFKNGQFLDTWMMALLVD